MGYSNSVQYNDKKTLLHEHCPFGEGLIKSWNGMISTFFTGKIYEYVDKTMIDGV